jgi:hypothetical protein
MIRRNKTLVVLFSWIFRLALVGLSLSLIPMPSGGRELGAWLLYQFVFFLCSIAPQFWFQTALWSRRPGFRSAIVLVGLLWKTKVGAILFACMAVQTGIVMYTLANHGVEPFPFAIPYTIVICTSVIILLLRPPMAIVLTGSRSRELMEIVAHQLWPYRIVALLDGNKLGTALFFSQQIDNLRAWSNIPGLPSDDWKNVVRKLVEVASIVVVDTRVPGDNLKWETGYMLDPERSPKAIFLAGPHGESPSLEANAEKARKSRYLKINYPYLVSTLEQALNHWPVLDLKMT